MMHLQPTRILLIENNLTDAYLSKESLMKGEPHTELDIVSNGEDALLFLHQKTPYTHAKRPNLILLDLHLPQRNGREVLKEIKEHPLLRSIPIVIFTSSHTEQDILESYNLHANCYITKPPTIEELHAVLSILKTFWFTIAKLPSPEHSTHP